MGTNLGDLLSAAGLKASEGAEQPEAPAEAAEPEGPSYAPKVVVRRTKKGRGGRTVTLVQGVTAGHELVAGTLKKELGTGARVEGDEVVVQGDQVERVARWLQSQGVKKVVRS
jgi:translation initiation factor 1